MNTRYSVGWMTALALLPMLFIDLVAGPGLLAQPQLEISLEADSSEIDRLNDKLVFRNILVSQGPLSVRAARAEGSSLEFDDSDWLFTGDVRIRDATTEINADRATLRFVAHRLREAQLTGQPVRFEHSAVAQDTLEPSQTVGQAGSIVYDFDAQRLRLSEDAWLSEGTNQIAGASIVYDIVGQRVVADSNGGDDDRVRITITPPAGAVESATQRTEDIDER